MTLSVDFFLNVSYQIQRIPSILRVLTVYLLGMLISCDEMFKWYFFFLFMFVDMVQFSSLQLLSCVQLFLTPWIAACQASLSITNTQSPPKRMSIELVMPSSHLILCCPLLLLPPIPAPKHQGLFQWVNSSHEVAKVLEFELQHQSFQWTPRTDLL